MLSDLHLNFNDFTTLWEILSLAIERQNCKPAFMVLVAKTLWECWQDRCKMAFGRQPFEKPAFILVRNMALIIKALLYKTTNSKKVAKLQTDIQLLVTLVPQFVSRNFLVFNLLMRKLFWSLHKCQYGSAHLN
jgi:hypothetical protein